MKNTDTILHIAVPSPLYYCFDYLLPEDGEIKVLQPGIRIRIPFGRREITGILLSTSTESQINYSKLKPAITILDQESLIPKSLIDLMLWISNYYHHPIGDVMANAFPKLLRQGKEATLRKYKPEISESQDKAIKLNSDQQAAITTISNKQNFQVFLLDGITGSGKTEVYLQVIEKVMAADKQALVLVPEIGLTPQTVARFQKRFGINIAVLHSKLTERERLNAWLLAQQGEAKIIIGTRSAIFTPMARPGIIIIDEEHDLSFKQQSSLKYSARDVAVMRSKLEDIPIVLGSATPSIESLYNVQKNLYENLSLPERVGNSTHPPLHLVDLRKQKMTGGIAAELILKIRQHLEQQGQVLLFLNRRGYAPVLLCHNCGWTAECERCDAKMTLHQSPKYLHCHHCAATKPVFKTCPQCQSEQVFALGAGTEKVEEALLQLFPEFTAVRIDKDTTARKHSLQKMLQDIHENQCQILIGTQMLAKGHHFPNITMAAILNADSGLLSSDFRAGEHMAQLIIQVAGRAGRAEKPAEVYIQTHNPHHELLQTLIQDGYHRFAAEILAEREAAALPPFSYIALLRAEAHQISTAMQFLTTVKATNISPQSVELQGPIAAPMQRKAGYHRAQLLISSESRADLHNFLNGLIVNISNNKTAHKVRWSLDVDPLDMG